MGRISGAFLRNLDNSGLPRCVTSKKKAARETKIIEALILIF